MRILHVRLITFCVFSKHAERIKNAQFNAQGLTIPDKFEKTFFKKLNGILLIGLRRANWKFYSLDMKKIALCLWRIHYKQQKNIKC
jgi:hypothetical protein